MPAKGSTATDGETARRQYLAFLDCLRKGDDVRAFKHRVSAMHAELRLLTSRRST